MADTPIKAKAPRADKGRRLTIVFSNRFAKLYDKIELAAKADDRDMDTFILRALDKAFATTEA